MPFMPGVCCLAEQQTLCKSPWPVELIRALSLLCSSCTDTCPELGSSCTPQSFPLWGLSLQGPAWVTTLGAPDLDMHLHGQIPVAGGPQACTRASTSCVLAGQAWEELAALRAPESGCTMDLRSRDAAVRAWARLAASGLLPCLDSRYSWHHLQRLHACHTHH